MIDPQVMAAADVVLDIAVAIPAIAVMVGGIYAVRRFLGVGGKSRAPRGETASDRPTDVELSRSAVATREAEAEVVPETGATEPAVPTTSEPAVEPAAEPVAEPATYRGRLGKARGLLAGYLGSVRSRGKIDATTWDDLEEALIRADVGVKATDTMLADLRARVKSGEIVGPDALVAALKGDLVAAVTAPNSELAPIGAAPAEGQDTAAGADVADGAEPERTVDVWLFVGVNGVGKTTTLGKVATRLAASGEKVLLAAGDTFRAAAGEQLALWASRSGTEIVRGAEGGDPSSVVFDAVQRAAARGHGLVLADTAGRLHNKTNLVEELKKIRRIADRPPGRVTEVLLVLDATTGQNGLAQARVFLDAVDVSGVVLTKLDGTAKGGIVVAIQQELGLPVKLVGLGEGPDDLVDFDPVAFVDALF